MTPMPTRARANLAASGDRATRHGRRTPALAGPALRGLTGGLRDGRLWLARGESLTLRAAPPRSPPRRPAAPALAAGGFNLNSRNIVALRVGDAVNALTCPDYTLLDSRNPGNRASNCMSATPTATTCCQSQSTSVYLDELSVNPDGTASLVQSFALPTVTPNSVGFSTGLPNLRCVNSGQATAEGEFTLSADGRFILHGCYDAPVGFGGVPSTPSWQFPRVIAKIDVLGGNIDTSVTMGTAYGGAAVRGAVSVDGNLVWTAGSGTGVMLVDYTRQMVINGTTTAWQILVNKNTTAGTTNNANPNPANPYGDFSTGRAIRIINCE